MPMLRRRHCGSKCTRPRTTLSKKLFRAFDALNEGSQLVRSLFQPVAHVSTPGLTWAPRVCLAPTHIDRPCLKIWCRRGGFAVSGWLSPLRRPRASYRAGPFKCWPLGSGGGLRGFTTVCVGETREGPH